MVGNEDGGHRQNHSLSGPKLSYLQPAKLSLEISIMGGEVSMDVDMIEKDWIVRVEVAVVFEMGRIKNFNFQCAAV